ncbi:uncharacterized protein [Chelonus insularis]|uniref:uncharacterized protein n=2 Tax=Chelonus insularis TaxID=460826 RepID=UPI00158AADE4|nr:uncharacterized protein LOC118072248 [Chelonus insularis]XP_034947884.1 uncharacterized protein LOC118072278 [Chelonus insularis]
MSQKHYSVDDKLILIDLVKQHSKVVENKRTDAVGNLEKDEAWSVITETFNKKVVFKRNTASLRNCWQHIKQCARKNAAQSKQQTRATGGGVNTGQMSIIDMAALEIIHPFSVEGLQNIFDSDAENECPNKVVFDHLLQTKKIEKWNKWDPKKLKASLSAPLRNAVSNVSQQIPSTSTGITNASRQKWSATELTSLKVEAFQLLKKSLTENQALEKEYLKTKLAQENLELEILKAKCFGLNKMKKNNSSNDNIKKNIASHAKVQKPDYNDENQQTASQNDDSILLSSESD